MPKTCFGIWFSKRSVASPMTHRAGVVRCPCLWRPTICATKHHLDDTIVLGVGRHELICLPAYVCRSGMGSHIGIPISLEYSCSFSFVLLNWWAMMAESTTRFATSVFGLIPLDRTLCDRFLRLLRHSPSPPSQGGAAGGIDRRNLCHRRVDRGL